MAHEEIFKDKYNVNDYRDVLNLAWVWKSYWQLSKRAMINGFHWYFKEIPIVTPKQVEPHIPSTAASLVNDAADHLAGNDPTFLVKALKESQKADEDRQRVQTALNGTFEIIGRRYGSPIHRILALHGGWSGMQVARIQVDEDWDPKNPTIEDIIWQPQDPRHVLPDPASGGRDAVIIWQQTNVGLVRQQWPNWDGHWYPTNSNQSYAGPYTDNRPPSVSMDGRERMDTPLDDNSTCTWIEYWDGKYKCFIANGVPVFQEEYGYDLIEHGLGCNPYVIRAAGYGAINGEAQHRYRSMLNNVFSELETEAALITQLKWIVQETAWPIYLAPKDVEGDFDLEPGSLNLIENPESIKAIRALREDAVESKSIIELLGYIKDEIERATYPVILKGQAPSGIRAGYPIAILSTQARMKFAAPTDALKDSFKELAHKTLCVIANRFKTDCEVMDGVKFHVDDYEKYLGRIDIKLEPRLPQDLASKLPLLEFLLGSAGFSKADAIRELGYDNPEDIRELRMAEDLEDDPRVRQVQVEHLISLLSPEAAAAVAEVSEPNLQVQKLQEVVQQLQGQMQVMQLQQQVQQLQGQQGAQPPGGVPGQSTQGAPQVPGGAPPMPQAPVPGGGVPGHAGGTAFGQNLQAPGQTGQAQQQINPDSALSIQARAQRSLREIIGSSAQEQAYGSPNGPVG